MSVGVLVILIHLQVHAAVVGVRGRILYLMVKHLKAAFLFQKHGLAHHFRSVPLVGVLVVGMNLCVDAGVSEEA